MRKFRFQDFLPYRLQTTLRSSIDSNANFHTLQPLQPFPQLCTDRIAHFFFMNEWSSSKLERLMTMLCTKILHNFHFYKPTMKSPTFTSGPSSPLPGSIHTAQNTIDMRKPSRNTHQAAGKCCFCTIAARIFSNDKEMRQIQLYKVGTF